MSLNLKAGVVAATWLLAGGPAIAVDLGGFDTKTPEISFDIPDRLVCRDVTTDEFRALHPKERLLRIEAPVSLLLYHGEARRIRDVVIEVDGASAGLRVHDYTPRTELTSELAGPIEVKQSEGVDKSLGATIGAKLAGDVALTPAISGGLSKSKTETETITRLPPKQAVLVSGTTNERRGVFFKLSRSSQTTLEGEHVFGVTFISPEDWAGGEIEVRCLARGRQKWLVVEQRRVWNETTRPVELRLVSHTVAKPVDEQPVASPSE